MNVFEIKDELERLRRGGSFNSHSSQALEEGLMIIEDWRDRRSKEKVKK